ncbi:MAG: hypothetical protein JW734_03315 [Candidatus Omnitrophica bacterium]|nr:hypothetical protein [Candidatus Omnitrophota bacterium]
MIIKKSLTFMEIVVSAMILASALAGLLASFVAVRRAVLRTDTRLAAYNLARQVLEDLYKDVDQATWDSGPLRIASNVPVGTVTIPPENIAYDLTYDVSGVAGQDYREVTVRVRYPEN